jgi:hypothetical protein
MLDPLTILEVRDLMAAVDWQAKGISLADERMFVLNHAYADAVYVARDDMGELHGVAFGWPVRDPAEADGRAVDEPDGTFFYVNLMLTANHAGGLSASDIRATLAERVLERHPQVRFIAYRRAKYADRFKVYEIERMHG